MLMKTTTSPTAKIVTVKRHPESARKIPRVTTAAELERRRADKEDEKMWEGTTPQGREIIRKTLFGLLKQRKIAEGTWVSGLPKAEPKTSPPSVEGEQEAVVNEFWDQIGKIATALGDELYGEALRCQNVATRERIEAHLASSRHWPEFKAAATLVASAFEKIELHPDYVECRPEVMFFKIIAAQAPDEPVPATA